MAEITYGRSSRPGSSSASIGPPSIDGGNLVVFTDSAESLQLQLGRHRLMAEITSTGTLKLNITYGFNWAAID